MEEIQKLYKGEFTIEERKAMTANALQMLRKGQKLSQKEVAAAIGIPATTYNTYESGRSEPPIEILVRLSHLYSTPVDVIVMRDRVYRTADDMTRQAIEAQKKVQELRTQLKDAGPEAEQFNVFVEMLQNLTDAMMHLSQTPGAQKVLEDTIKT